MKYDSVALIHLATSLLHTESPASDTKLITDAIREMRSTITLTDADLIIRAADNTGKHRDEIHDALYLE